MQAPTHRQRPAPTPILAGALRGIALTLLAGLMACVSVPQNSISEALDERTGTTVTRLDRPLELVAVESRGPGSDPFAFFGTFETNRMGQRSLYLWLGLPDETGDAGTAVVSVDGRALSLGAAVASPAALSLGAFPYANPAPWSTIRVFVLSEAALAELSGATRIEIAVNYASNRAARFSGDVTPRDIFSAFRGRLGL